MNNNRRRLESLVEAPWLVPLIILLGLALRLIWLWSRGTIEHAVGEALNTAIAFARTGTLSDSFQRGQGPTAHLTPISPLIAGTVYSALGVKSWTSEFILMLWSLGLAVVASLSFFKAFAIAGASRAALLLGLAGFWLLPINFHMEVVNFRIWEGTLATALAGLFTLGVLHSDRTRDVSWGKIALLSLLAAVLFMVSPPLGLAAYFAALLLTLRTQPLRRWAGVAAIATLALTIVLGPWALRNQQVMGSFIPLRANFGLELALANHPAAISGGDERRIYVERLKEIHPFTATRGYVRLQEAGGEVAYAKKLGAEAQTWMAQNPLDTALLSAKHTVQYFFPPAWFFNVFDDTSQATGLKQAVLWALSLFGFAGMAIVVRQRRRQFDYLILMVLVPVLPYAITQPMLRYRYIMHAPLLFFASIAFCALIGALWRTIEAKQASSERASA